MKKSFLVKNDPSFHLIGERLGYFVPEIPSRPDISFMPVPRYIIEQQRVLRYRLYLHQHPYVQPLIKRLIRKGVSGLQAADTDYAAGEISLPYGVDVELDKQIDSTIKAGEKLAILENMTVQHSNGGTVDLNKGDEFELANNVSVKLFTGTRIILIDSMSDTPYPRVSFNLSENKNAAFFSDAPVEFTGSAYLKWAKDETVLIPLGRKAVIGAATIINIPAGSAVTVLRRKMQPISDFYANFFEDKYKPNTPNNEIVHRPYPVKDLDFTSSGAYSVYNWELFFHVPLTMAMQLSKNQRYAEAQQWFHYIFDPTDSSTGPTPERFWKVRPFQYTDVQKTEEILSNLATNADPDLRKDTVNSIAAWKDAPFRPHVVARYRQQSYMYKTVMAYLDNLIAWGDSLFRQDTGEAIDEAMQLYVMAANILGPRPLPVPKKGKVRPQNYANLRKDLKEFGAVMQDMEAAIGFDLMPLPAADGGDNNRLANIRSLGKALYFCVPRNDKLLSYWDTVADRLFKIRNSLNFQGVFRQLALFEPPIDPALLARAAASGLDVGAIVNGLNQPLPLVRFGFLIQKAAEIVQEVKSLGNNLLAAMEKEDGEAMALLRAKHERVMMGMVEQVRYGQLKEAIKAKEGLLQTLALAVQRHTYFERLLGRKLEDIKNSIPQLTELSKEDKDHLEKMVLTIEEPIMGLRDIDIDISSNIIGQVTKALTGGKLLSSHEVRETLLLELAQFNTDLANIMSLSGSGSHLVPTFKAQIQPLGAGTTIEFGGKELGSSANLLAGAARAVADRLNFEARRAARIDTFARREQEWMHQSNLAAGEISQIFKQLRAAQIREAVAELELRNHRKQMEHAAEIEKFLNEEGTEKNGKKTNKALYAWMKREVKGLYSQCFQFAFDIAKKAERALQHELGNPELSYLQFGYLAGKEGLLAGEKLYLDIKRMEMAYHDQNQREYELTKYVSLLQVDPLALIQLRTTGRCTMKLPESLFDMDGPGHYFRRIKTVSVSIPCVIGPYASVNCTLTLVKSSIRKTPILSDGYDREDTEDTRFSDNFGSLQSIVTSSAQNDSGLFDTNLRDERYLPFENSGVISEWNLELPSDIRQFDYSTISDVILHIRYTAREGGGLLRKGAVDNLKTLIKEAQAAGTMRLFSIRQEFPTEWAKFQKQSPNADKRYELTLNFQEEHYPFWSKGKLESVARIDLFAQSEKNKLDVFDALNNQYSFVKSNSFGELLTCKLSKIPLPGNPVGELKLFLSDKIITNLWIAITWSGKF